MTDAGAPRKDGGSAGALAGRRLLVATPMYEGMCHALYTRGLVELALQCREQGILLKLNFVVNQPNLNQARAYIAGGFLQSDCDHLMMIDSDIGFSATDVLTLLNLQVQGGHDVIGAAYSHKRVDWDRVGGAARADGGIDLARVASSVTVNLSTEEGTLQLDRPQAVNELATGFLMASRGAFERVAAHCPDLTFRPTPDARRGFGLGEQATAFFNTTIDEHGRYLTQDYAFCRRVRAAGMQVWLCPWIELAHVGNMTFSGSITEIARLATILSNVET